MSIKFYPVVPVSAPRQVRKDKWDPSPHVQKYRAFRDEVRIRGVRVPIEGFHIVFLIPMPKSWPNYKKEKMRYKPHRQKPDKDNLEKALLDALYGEDSFIWTGTVTKLWHDTGGIVVDDYLNTTPKRDTWAEALDLVEAAEMA